MNLEKNEIGERQRMPCGRPAAVMERNTARCARYEKTESLHADVVYFCEA